MTVDLAGYRRFFAEEIQMIANIKTPELVDALGTVPREKFLPPGPWVVRGEADFMAPLRKTPDDDPRHVHHNIAVGIDPGRMLFNGAPNVVAGGIDALGLAAGKRVLHIGAGAGYYSAVIGATVGASGRVTAIEVDADLAARAAKNVADMPWVSVRHGDARDLADIGGGAVDAIMMNTGITHPERRWLDALSPGGRINLSLTATMDLAGVAHPAGNAMANIGKGFMIVLTKTADPDRYDARIVTFVAIYSAIGLRDAETNTLLGRAMAKTPFPPLKSYRLDAHDAADTCWCHTSKGCWSTT